MERINDRNCQQNNRSPKPNSETYFNNGFSSADEDEDLIDNISNVNNVLKTKPLRVSTGSQVDDSFKNSGESDEYSYRDSLSSSEGEDGVSHPVDVNKTSVSGTKTGCDSNTVNSAKWRDIKNGTNSPDYNFELSGHGINIEPLPSFHNRRNTLETRRLENEHLIPRSKKFNHPCETVFDNGFSDSDDERLVSLTFSNHFGNTNETKTPFPDNDNDDNFVSLTFDNNFLNANNDPHFLRPPEFRGRQSKNVDFGESGRESEDDDYMDGNKFSNLTTNNAFREPVPRNSTETSEVVKPIISKDKRTAAQNTIVSKLIVTQSGTDSHLSTSIKENVNENRVQKASRLLEEKKIDVLSSCDGNEDKTLLDNPRQQNGLQMYSNMDMENSNEKSESSLIPMESQEITKILPRNDSKITELVVATDNSNSISNSIQEVELKHGHNDNGTTQDDKSNTTGVSTYCMEEKVDKKTGDVDLLQGDSRVIKQLPFTRKFNSIGIQSKGQNIFEMQMQKNNFESISDSLLFGDDLDIDGEPSLNLGPAKSLEIPTGAEKLKDNKNVEIEVIPKTSTPFPSPNKEVQQKNSTVPTQKSSLGAYDHTCSGCGRKDCDGSFMKLLRAMIKTGQNKGFELRNVVPDGNCMFAAVTDQLEILGQSPPSPMALRQSCTEYLKQHPECEDGTPFYMFLDGESWEDYLEKMSQEGKWGDHLMLQAVSSVINRNIIVINGEIESNWNRIHPQNQDSVESDPIYLGHVGELHYVSMRPVEKAGDEALFSLDLYSVEPSLPNIGDSSQQLMFMEDYIDPWCSIPSVHLTFLIKQFMPMSLVLKNADSMCHTAFAMEYPCDETTAHTGSCDRVVQFKSYGVVIDGLASYFDCETGNLENGSWADVDTICYFAGMIAYPSSHESGTVDSSDVIVDSSECHAGYVRLYKVNATSTQRGGSHRYFLPNHRASDECAGETKHQKEQSARNRPSPVISLYHRKCSGVFSPFWPEEASNWITRTRNTNWPPQNLIQSIVSEGVYYISKPHHSSRHPNTEFQTCFGVAERRLANEALTKEQRYCFIVFRAIIDFSVKEKQLIDITHLKTIFFFACEQIPEQYWVSRTTACILFMLDNLLRHLETRNIPNYFIESNNMIDHLSDDQVQSLMNDLRNTRSQPIVVLYSIAYKNKVENANDFYQAILFDIEDFQRHKSVRQSVIFTLVPAKIKQAARYIELNSFEAAIEVIQEAHEDRLLVSTCEDNIPFVAFITEVTNNFGLFKQWWLCVYADETLGTALAAELSLLHNPIPLQEVVGLEVADRHCDILVPKPLVEKPLTLCISFYDYFWLKHRTKRAMAYLVKAREFYLKFSKNRDFSDFPATIDEDDMNVLNVFTIYRCLVHNYVTTTSSEPLSSLGLDQIAGEVESICEQVKSEESYSVLRMMYKYLGQTAKMNQMNAKLESLHFRRE